MNGLLCVTMKNDSYNMFELNRRNVMLMAGGLFAILFFIIRQPPKPNTQAYYTAYSPWNEILTMEMEMEAKLRTK